MKTNRSTAKDITSEPSIANLSKMLNSQKGVMTNRMTVSSEWKSMEEMLQCSD